MNDTHLYLPLVPECLVASMLSPEDFGAYLAVGSTSRFRGQAVFFEIDPDFKSDHFPMNLIEEQCVPKEDGKPKNSLYLSIYQVLEHIPISALGDLHLATDDGKVLTLKKQDYQPEENRLLHLYQEFGPVNPSVASTLRSSAQSTRRWQAHWTLLIFVNLSPPPLNPSDCPRLSSPNSYSGILPRIQSTEELENSPTITLNTFVLV